MLFPKLSFSSRRKFGPRSRIATTIVITCLVFASGLSRLSAEIFQLENGGILEGRLLNPTDNPRILYEIGLPSGARIVLPSSCVEHLRAPREDRNEYELRRINSPDTVEGQYDMAVWCSENGLRNESNAHHQRVLVLDPDHTPSRHSLGYSQRDGHWSTQEDFMENRGYVQYLGRWRLPQEVLIDQQNREFREREGQWRQDLRLWRNLLNGGRSSEAQRNILAITDPIAVGPLVTMLEEERDERVRRLYLETLNRIGTPSAIMAIVYWSIEEPLEDVRIVCYGYMEGYSQVVDFFTSRLYNADPGVINEAAYVLRIMEDPRPVPDLIARLVTTHRYTRTIGSDQMGGTFDNRNGINMTQGSREVTEDRTEDNEDVLAALKHLTGVDYGFDVSRWRQWWGQRRELDHFRSRRDL
jgi:hypothetical protein